MRTVRALWWELTKLVFTGRGGYELSVWSDQLPRNAEYVFGKATWTAEDISWVGGDDRFATLIIGPQWLPWPADWKPRTYDTITPGTAAIPASVTRVMDRGGDVWLRGEERVPGVVWRFEGGPPETLCEDGMELLADDLLEEAPLTVLEMTTETTR